MIIVAVKDTVAGEFGDLGTYKSLDVAVRSFDNLCKQSPFAGDLQLFKVAEYDNDSGIIVPDLRFIKNGVLKHESVEL